MSASPFPTTFDNPLPDSNDNLSDRMAKVEARVLSAEQMTSGGVFSGNLTVTGNLVVTGFIDTAGFLGHERSTTVNAAPVAGEFYHDSTSGVPAIGNGVALDFTLDSASVKRQIGARWITSWTIAADATRTSQVRLFLPSAGTLSQVLAISPTTLGFFGVAAVARPSVPDGSTLAVVIDALQALGLFAP